MTALTEEEKAQLRSKWPGRPLDFDGHDIGTRVAPDVLAQQVVEYLIEEGNVGGLLDFVTVYIPDEPNETLRRASTREEALRVVRGQEEQRVPVDDEQLQRDITQEFGEPSIAAVARLYYLDFMEF